MITSGLQAIPLPEPSDPDNVPYHLGLAVAALEQRVVMRFPSKAARDAALTSPVEGMLCGVAGVGLTYRLAGEWVDLHPKPRRVMLVQNTVQTGLARNGWYNVAFDGESFDGFGLHDSGSALMLGRQPGVWLVSGVVSFAADATGSTRRAAIAVNGARFSGSFTAAAPSASQIVLPTGVVQLTVTDPDDVVTVQMLHDADGSLATYVSAEARCSVSAVRLGPA